MPTGVYKRIKGKKYGGFQKGHTGYKTWLGKKLSKEHIKKLSNAKLGKKDNEASRWLGDNVGYARLHTWIRQKLGAPRNCEECGNKGLKHTQYHWSNISHKYLRDFKDWKRLCVSCHKKYDSKNRKLKIKDVMFKKWGRRLNHFNQYKESTKI